MEERRSEKLAFAEIGEGCLLAGLALREESRYLGGVTNTVPGVAGGVAAGSKPRSERWVGVRGMSERSSVGRKRGERATITLKTKKSWRMNNGIS